MFAQKNNDALLAEQFYKSGNYTKAIELYTQLYDTHKSGNYYQNLLDSYLKLQHLENSEKLVKRHNKKHPNNPSTIVDFAHILTLQLDEKKAKKKFNEMLNLLREKPQFVSTAANKLYKYGYLQYAIQAYNIALKDPKKSNYRFQLARIYGELGEIDKMYNNYLDLILSNKGYLQSVKISLNRTINNDSENENNQLLKSILIKKVQETNNQNLADILIWLFIQEKNFDAAFDQEKAMDQKFNLNQKKIYELASICRKNKAYNTAQNCYSYIISLGTVSPYYLDSQMAILNLEKQILESSPETNNEQWLQLEVNIINGLNKLGRTSYTVLLLKDLAQIQAFQIHDIAKASTTIQEALNISNASAEDLAKCKLLYADILLLKNEVWDAIINYSQVDKAFKHDLLGHEAKFRRAKISYYQGDFDWAQAQLDVLKKSTSKLIANNAMGLSLLIQDNLNLDTTTVTMEIFARADLQIYQNKLDEAYNTLDSIVIGFQGHSLVDEVLYKQHQIRMSQGQIQDASELLDQIISFFSYDILADDAKFAQAQLQENYFKNNEKASELYQDIITNHQDSFYISESRKRYRTLRENKL